MSVITTEILSLYVARAVMLLAEDREHFFLQFPQELVLLVPQEASMVEVAVAQLGRIMQPQEQVEQAGLE